MSSHGLPLQADTVTEYRIRVAVLENNLAQSNSIIQKDVQHTNSLREEISLLQEQLSAASKQSHAFEAETSYAIKERDEAVQSSMAIVRAMCFAVKQADQIHAGGLPAADVEELRNEIRKLESENLMLWRRVASKGDPASAALMEVEVESREKREDPARIDAIVDRIMAMTATEHVVSNVEENKDFVSNQLGGGHEYRQDSRTREIPSSRQRLSTNAKIVDVGMPDLDKLLDDDSDDDMEVQLEKAGEATVDVGMPDLDKLLDDDSDDDIEMQMAKATKAMASLQVVPPTIYKTGFGTSYGKRGETYTSNFEPDVKYRGNFAASPRFQKNYSPLVRFGSQTSSPAPPHNYVPAQGDTKEALLLSTIGTDKLWTNEDERNEEIASHRMSSGRPTGQRLPDYFQFGVTFQPTAEDHDVFRAVSIADLPQGITLSNVVDRIRGGQILSATVGVKNEVIVVFAKQEAAELYIAYTAQHPVLFDSSRANITQIKTPTFPMSSTLQHWLNARQHTRSLTILSPRPGFSLARFKLDLANHYLASSLLSVHSAAEDALALEFSSIGSAVFAYSRILRKFPGYRGLIIYFNADPCADSLEDLLLPVPAKQAYLEEDAEQTSEDDIDAQQIVERRQRLGELAQMQRSDQRYGAMKVAGTGEVVRELESSRCATAKKRGDGKTFSDRFQDRSDTGVVLKGENEKMKPEDIDLEDDGEDEDEDEEQIFRDLEDSDTL